MPCFGITVCLEDGAGTVVSDLLHGSVSADAMERSVYFEGLEQLVLGHAIAGLDITGPAYAAGVERAVLAAPQ
jgi:hypothetical protein